MGFELVCLCMKDGVKAAMPQMSKHWIQKLGNVVNTVRSGLVLGMLQEKWALLSPGCCQEVKMFVTGYLYNFHLDGGTNEVELKL